MAARNRTTLKANINRDIVSGDDGSITVSEVNAILIDHADSMALVSHTHAYADATGNKPPANAERNVQVDWNEARTGNDAFIKNKPTIPAAQVQTDWEAAITEKNALINKPNFTHALRLPSTEDVTAGYVAKVQSDETLAWEAETGGGGGVSLGSATPTNVKTSGAASQGTSTDAARDDHSHIMANAHQAAIVQNRLDVTAPLVQTNAGTKSTISIPASAFAATSHGTHLPTTSGVTTGYVPKVQSDASIAWAADETGSGGGSGEENVQSDWTETDTTDDAFILNKPTVPGLETGATSPIITTGTATQGASANAAGAFHNHRMRNADQISLVRTRVTAASPLTATNATNGVEIGVTSGTFAAASHGTHLPTTTGVTDGYVPKKQSDGSVAWAADSTGSGGGGGGGALFHATYSGADYANTTTTSTAVADRAVNVQGQDQTVLFGTSPFTYTKASGVWVNAQPCIVKWDIRMDCEFMGVTSTQILRAMPRLLLNPNTPASDPNLGYLRLNSRLERDFISASHTAYLPANTSILLRLIFKAINGDPARLNITDVLVTVTQLA